MSEVINLRRARKARDRADKAVVAAANRLAHGRTKRDRDAAAAQSALSERALDGAKRSD